MCALKVDSNPPVSKGTFHCRLKGANMVKSAVFDQNTGKLLVQYYGHGWSDSSSRDYEKTYLGLWTVENGVVSNSHLVTMLDEDINPTTVAIVDVGNKRTLVLRTVNRKDESVHLCETNIFDDEKDITDKWIDTSKLGRSRKNIASWKNLLFVSADISSEALHVFKNLEYHSKMKIPVKSEPTIRRYSFSDEYFVVQLRSTTFDNTSYSVQAGIYAYKWSPENLTIGDLILGPVEGCVIGTHAQLSPHYIVTNKVTDEEYASLQRLAIYNIKEKSVSYFLLQDQDETERVELIIELSGKTLIVLGRGSVFELN